MNLDPLYVANFILCLVIVVMGYLTYTKRKNSMALYVLIAFGLFGLSHLGFILDLVKNFELLFIAIRTIAYIAVIYGLYEVYSKK
jgi:hypothetical protein